MTVTATLARGATAGRRKWLAAALLALAVPGWPGAVPEAVPEYYLKATYIIKIATSYVRWPDGAFANTHGVINLCIIGRDDFGASIDRLVAEQKELYGQAIDIQRIPSLGRGAADCHIAFLGQSERDNLAADLAVLSMLPVLTFSDIDGFAAQGGMVELVLLHKNLKFKIDPGAGRRVGLEMKAQLLSSAIELTGVKP